MKNTITRIMGDSYIILNNFKIKAIGYRAKINKQEYDIMLGTIIKIRNDITCSLKAHKLIETLNNNPNASIYNECIDKYMEIIINKEDITTLYELYEQLNKYLDLNDTIIELNSSNESLIKKVQAKKMTREEELFLINNIKTKNNLTVLKKKIMRYKEVVYSENDKAYYCIGLSDKYDLSCPSALLIKKLQVTEIKDNVDTMEKANELIKKIIK